MEKILVTFCVVIALLNVSFVNCEDSVKDFFSHAKDLWQKYVEDSNAFDDLDVARDYAARLEELYDAIPPAVRDAEALAELKGFLDELKQNIFYSTIDFWLKQEHDPKH